MLLTKHGMNHSRDSSTYSNRSFRDVLRLCGLGREEVSSLADTARRSVARSHLCGWVPPQRPPEEAMPSHLLRVCLCVGARYPSNPAFDPA
jgi:hypothetical protein